MEVTTGEECVLPQHEGKEDIFCCLSGEVEEGNDIVLCDSAQSPTLGWHQKWLNPPLANMAKGVKIGSKWAPFPRLITRIWLE